MPIGTQSAVPDYELLLVFDNWALGTEGATVTATSTAAGNLVAANLLTSALDLGWRSGSIAALVDAGASVVTLRWSLGQPRTVDWVSLHRSNIRVPFRARFFRGTLALPGSPVFESPWTDPIVRAKSSEFATFSGMPWTLGPKVRDVNLWQSLFRLDSLIQAPTTHQNVRTVEVDFDLAGGSNAGVDYFQVGMPMIGHAFRPRVNMLLDWELGVEDRSDTHRTESGALLGRQRSRGRTFGFTLGYLDRDEAFARIFTGWMRRHGKLGRLFAWPEPEHRRYFYDTAMIATAINLPKIAMLNLDWPAGPGWLLEETE